MQIRNSHPEVFAKKIFLKILRNFQQNFCTEERYRSPDVQLKRGSIAGIFLMNSAKILGTHLCRTPGDGYFC